MVVRPSIVPAVPAPSEPPHRRVLFAATVLPTIAGANSGYVGDVIAAITGGTPDGDIGTLRALLRVQDIAYLAGGLVFGVAMFRARVLARWATALLAFGGVVTVVVSLLPDPFYRLVAVPNGVALIALGFSLWRSVGDTPDTAGTRHGPAAGRPTAATPA